MIAATKLDNLALALLDACDDRRRVLAVAARLAELAGDLHAQENAAVPAHLRTVPDDLPPGVAAIWKNGRWIERQKGRRT